MIDGILAVDKPQGWTSHDVVGRVRRVAGQRQVGHAGTLDPLATGLLLVVLGRATRVSSYLMESEKVYCAEVVLGVSTSTDDAEGNILGQATVPNLSRADLESCLAQFVGEIDQIPPTYAAVRQGGERLYKLARKGVNVSPAPRRVVIHEILLQDFSSPRMRLRVRCGPGTYIRSLARDVGEAVGAFGYLHVLRRVASGTFVVEDAVALDGLTRDDVIGAAQPIDRAVAGWPAIVLNVADAVRVRRGLEVTLGVPVAGNVRLYCSSGTLVALGNARGGAVKPFRVFAGA